MTLKSNRVPLRLHYRITINEKFKIKLKRNIFSLIIPAVTLIKKWNLKKIYTFSKNLHK